MLVRTVACRGNFFSTCSTWPRLSSTLKFFSISNTTRLADVHTLESWDLKSFQDSAFQPQIPAKLVREKNNLPSACLRWFIHDGKHDFDLSLSTPTSSELRTAFWSEHEDTIVPLELTTMATEQDSPLPDATTGSQSTTSSFQRADAPLKLLLTYLSNPRSPSSSSLRQHSSSSIYLAQCDLRDLPTSLQADVPTPDLVKHAGKGDIYSSSLWMGRPPTYTPLHRDPNPNLFVQLAGKKQIRLFAPEIGNAIFEHVQHLLVAGQERSGGHSASTAAAAAFRGEEMMQGAEKDLLHRLVWGGESDKDDVSDGRGGEGEVHNSAIMQHAQQATLTMGEALFIPKGWWHSVKGVGEGVTASVNWWFR